LAMPKLKGNRWAVKRGLLEDDSSGLVMFKVANIKLVLALIHWLV